MKGDLWGVRKELIGEGDSIVYSEESWVEREFVKGIKFRIFVVYICCEKFFLFSWVVRK